MLFLNRNEMFVILALDKLRQKKLENFRYSSAYTYAMLVSESITAHINKLQPSFSPYSKCTKPIRNLFPLSSRVRPFHFCKYHSEFKG